MSKILHFLSPSALFVSEYPEDDEQLKVNPDSLGDRGKAIYDEISDDLFPTMCERLYAEAQTYMDAGNYEYAISDLEQVIQMKPKYESGKAMKLLGDAYAAVGETEKAVSTYEKVIKNHSGKKIATKAQEAIDELNTNE